jgi:hypothetical protein
MADLLALADRVEKAAGPDRELDFWIGTRIEGTRHTDEEIQADIDQLGIEGMYIPAAYTASLDAAMTLVPEGWFPSISKSPRDFLNDGEPDWGATITGPVTWSKDPEYGFPEPIFETANANATAHSLALTAACLRARHAQDHSHE